MPGLDPDQSEAGFLANRSLSSDLRPCRDACLENDVVIVETPAELSMCGDFGVSHIEIGVRRVIALPVLACAALDVRSPLATKPFIGEKCRRNADWISQRQNFRQRYPIFD